MTVSLQRIDQIHKPDTFDDTRNAASIAGSEASDVDFADHTNARLSQIKRIIYGNTAGNWHDDPATIGPAGHPDISLYNLGQRSRLEDKLVLKNRLNLGDITVPGSQNWVALTGAAQLPDKVIAILNTTRGAVVAQLGGAIGAHSLVENSGLNAVRPKNLLNIFDGDTGDAISSGGRRVYGLLQVGNLATDGNAFATSGNDQPQISFVRVNATNDDLEAVPVADIENAKINYTFSNRDDLDSCPEESFRGDLDTAQGVAGGVSLDEAYNGGTFMEVDGSDVDIRLADTTSWVFRAGAGGNILWQVTRDDGGTTQIQVGSTVDVFNNDAADSNFAEGMSLDTAGQPINLGKTGLGIIDSATLEMRSTTGDVLLNGADDVSFQTVRETSPLPFDDATAGPISGVGTGSHASIAAAIQEAFESGGVDLAVNVFIAGSNYAQGANIPGATFDLTSYTLDMNTPGNTDMFLFLNGRLLYGGNGTTKNDVYAGDTPASGDIKVDFAKGIKSGDVLISIGLQQ